MEHTIRFRPLAPETLKMMREAYDAEGEDPVAAYSRLISAALVSGAMLNLDEAQIKAHVDAFYPSAQSAVEEVIDDFTRTPPEGSA